MEPFVGQRYLKVRADPDFETQDIAWEADLPGVSIRRLYNELSVPSGLPALLLTILFAFITEGLARTIAVLAIVGFGVVVARRVIDRTRHS